MDPIFDLCQNSHYFRSFTVESDGTAIITTTSGMRYAAKVTNEHGRPMQIYEERQWHRIADQALRILNKKNISSDPVVALQPDITIDVEGVRRDGQRFYHDQANATRKNYDRFRDAVAGRLPAAKPRAPGSSAPSSVASPVASSSGSCS